MHIPYRNILAGNRNKAVILILLIAAAIVLGFALFGLGGPKQDSWVCENGTWVRYGSPQGPVPESGCGEGVIN